MVHTTSEPKGISCHRKIVVEEGILCHWWLGGLVLFCESSLKQLAGDDSYVAAASYRKLGCRASNKKALEANRHQQRFLTEP